MANQGAESFFGGFAEGLGSGLLQREQMLAQKKARESEQKMELWKLIYSNPDIPDATKLQFGKMVFQQPPQEGPISRIKGALHIGKGQKKQQPPTAAEIFQKLQDAMMQQGGGPAPASSTPPLPSVGGGADVSPSSAPTAGTAPTAIPNLPGVRQGPGGMPYDPGISGGRSGIPPLPDLSTARGRETQQYLQETQEVTNIQRESARKLHQEQLDDTIERINKLPLDQNQKNIALVEATTGKTFPAGARPETLDQTAADLFQQYQSGKISEDQFKKGVDALHSIVTSVKPQTAAGSKAPTTKNLMVKGKLHTMAWNPSTQRFDIDMGLAAEATGYPRVFPVNDAQGNTTGYNVIRALPSGGFEMSKMALKQPIPPKPTGSVLTQSQRAKMIQPQVEATIAEVQRIRGQLGPLAGRWNDFMAGRIGTANPQLADLQQRLQLFATALMLAHGLRGESYEKNLERYLNAAQSPDNLIARIKAADSFLQDYAASTGHGPTAPATNGKGGALAPVPKPATGADPLGIY